MQLRARRGARAAGGAAAAAAVDASHRGGAQGGGEHVPPPPEAPPTPTPPHDTWECVICWAPLPRRRSARVQAARARCDDATAALLPGDLPCGHACCAGCLVRYVHAAVPRVQRAGAPLVRCPGVISAPPGWDLRCPTPLPRPLVLSLLPRARAGGAEDGGVAAGGGGALATALRSLSWEGAAWRRRCPTCGTLTELDGGCSSVRCAICLTDWCFSCGKRLAHAHAWHSGCVIAQLLEAFIVLFASLLLSLFLALVLAIALAAVQALLSAALPAPPPVMVYDV